MTQVSVQSLSGGARGGQLRRPPAARTRPLRTPVLGNGSPSGCSSGLSPDANMLARHLFPFPLPFAIAYVCIVGLELGYGTAVIATAGSGRVGRRLWARPALRRESRLQGLVGIGICARRAGQLCDGIDLASLRGDAISGRDPALLCRDAGRRRMPSCFRGLLQHRGQAAHPIWPGSDVQAVAGPFLVVGRGWLGERRHCCAGGRPAFSGRDPLVVW